MKRFPLAAAVLIGLLVSCAAAHHASGSPVTDNADRYFVTPGTATVTWPTTSSTSNEPVAYTLRDFHGRAVSTGHATVRADKTATATLSVGPGYYEIELADGGRRIGVVALPQFTGRMDPFFAIDSALSWLVRADATREGLIRVLRRTGIAMSRERLSWEQIHPAADRWDWDTGRHYDLVRQTYGRQGVEVLEMFHSAPVWAGRVGKYPDDLVATARAWPQIARHWRPTWGALEIWNEPEISFGGLLPGDQYVAIVKAVAYGLAQARIEVPLVGGVFAHGPRPFLDNVAANGLLECVDTVSFHTYDRAASMERIVGKYREWLAAHGRPSAPLWITECGRPWRRGPGRPPADQDAVSALDITMKAVEARACGIARHFPFVYPYYEERENNFGMMDRQAAPLRSMAAYAQAVRVLSGKRYLGDLRTEDASIQRARVFGDAQGRLCVLYTGRVELAAKARLPASVLRAEGIDGRPLEIAHGSPVVPIPDGLTYVWLARDPGEHLQSDTPAMRWTKVAQAAVAPRATPSPIVLRHQFDAKRLSPTPAGYHVPPERAGKVPLAVRAFNLGAEARELSLQIKFASKDVKLLDAATRQLRVPATGSADVTWLADLSRAFAADNRLRVTVRAGGRRAAEQLSFDLIGEAPFAQVLDRYRRRVALDTADSARWHPSIARGGRITLTHSPAGECRLEAHFGQGDRWVYPRFDLPDKLDLTRWSALVFRARCQHPATVRVFLWEGGGVGYLTPVSVVPADGRWHAAVVRFADLESSSANAPDANGRLDLKEVRRISIGMNSQAAENSLEFADVHLVDEGK
jgi:hypothetical protein